MGADAVTVHDLIEKLSKALLPEFKIISREEYRRIMHNAGSEGEKMKITKEFLRDNRACSPGYEWFLVCGEIEHDAVINKLMAENHHDWANWLIVRLMTNDQRISYAIFSAEMVIDNYENVYPEDERPRKAIEAARNYIKNKTKENKSAALAAGLSAALAAESAASAAALAARSAALAAESAALAAESAALAALSAVFSTAGLAAESAALAAGSAALAARSAALAALSAALAAGLSADSAALRTIIEYGLNLVEGKVV